MTAPATYPSLSGRSVFITGGASGIGAAFVRAAAAQGMRVGFVDIQNDAATALISEVSATGALSPWYRHCDVTKPDALQAAIHDFADEAGGLWGLINNAANDRRQNVMAITPEDWQSLMAINLDTAFFAAQAALPLMRSAGGGSIITLSSINARLAPPELTAYSAAKAGLVALTKALAKEAGDGQVRANVILPGWVVTERQLEDYLTTEEEEAWTKLCALKERIQPEDVADLALFLLSDASQRITGQSFTIDNGRTC